MNASETLTPPTTEKLRVRRVTEDDVGLLAEMIRELADFENRPQAFSATEADLARFIVGDEKCADAVIIWLEEAPAGFAIYYRTFSSLGGRPGLWIEDLFVRAPFRHRGVFPYLLRELTRIAYAIGAQRLEWNTLESNTETRVVYAALGASELNDWVQLRMDGPAIAQFAGVCRGHAGSPQGGCRCGERGHSPDNTRARSAACNCSV